MRVHSPSPSPYGVSYGRWAVPRTDRGVASRSPPWARAETPGPPRAWKGALGHDRVRPSGGGAPGGTSRRRPFFASPSLLRRAVVAAGRGAACGWLRPRTRPAASRATLTVFAASSLTEAFTQLGTEFTAAHPDVKVNFDFAGSNDLVTQLQQGAPADVLATADTGNMDKVAGKTGAPQDFAGNKLMIAVEPGNPEAHHRARRPGRKDLKVVLAAPEVPAGKYAQEALAKAGVTVQPVSLEDSVKGVVTKVSLGEADAGIVYVTDIDAAQGKIDGVDDPGGPERDRDLPDRDGRTTARIPTTPRRSSTSCSRPAARRSWPSTGSCPRREEPA